MSWAHAVVGFAASLAVAASGCGGGARPNVILVTVDTMRADHLSPYGGAVATPAVERFANAGIIFERAFCEVTWTIPSMASVMTGTYPDEHGIRTVYDNLGDGHTTLAELLQRAGYHRAGIVASYPLDRSFGFAKGFDLYDDVTTQALVNGGEPPDAPSDAMAPEPDRDAWIQQRVRNSAYRPDDAVADRAIAWLDEAPPEPYFLWVHFFGPHDKPHRRERLLASPEDRAREYRQDVASFDAQFGRFLDRVDRDPAAARTLVILHSDHGETLTEHATTGHGLDVYDTTAHVPLIIRLPGGERAGERVRRLVGNLDIFATVLARAGVPTPAASPSIDLLGPEPGRPHVPLSTSMAAARPIAQPVEHDGNELRVGLALRGVRTRRWKLIRWKPVLAYDWPERDRHRLRPAVQAHLADEKLRRIALDFRFALFDLTGDPTEQLDVAPLYPERIVRLSGLLRSFEPGGPAAGRGVRSLDAKAQERLRALGYLE